MRVVADATSARWLNNELSNQEVTMLAEMSAVLGTIATLAFVLFVLGVVVYAVVRPFTHRDHEHRSGLWVHLP
jgi:hypothetical protein